MSNFKDRLWRDLVREHGAQLAQIDGTAARHGRRARARVLAGTTVGLAAVGTTLALVLARGEHDPGVCSDSQSQWHGHHRAPQAIRRDPGREREACRLGSAGEARSGQSRMWSGERKCAAGTDRCLGEHGTSPTSLRAPRRLGRGLTHGDSRRQGPGDRCLASGPFGPRETGAPDERRRAGLSAAADAASARTLPARASPTARQQRQQRLERQQRE